ncbi:MAG: FkbM family methyltransferase, partial [Hyphomonadaceae bacterium]|nr:FkbM family methyltransferase [Hyphomonadaceae bacterium]
MSKTAASIAKRILWPTMTGPLDVTTWGIAMRLDPRRNITEKRLLLSPSRFELAERELLHARLKVGDQFVDVGANVGAYTMWVAQIVGPSGRCVAIEPQPSVLARLRANIQLNPNFNVTLFPCGAGPKDDVMALSIGGSNEGGASIAMASGGTHRVDVRVRPLLDMVVESELSRIDALKIDIEGYEDQALIPFFKAAPKHLWPRLMILERSEKDWQQDLLGLLKSLISTPSPSRQEGRTADLLQAFLKKQNIQSHREANNVWAMSKRFDASRPTLLLNSHHDTVPP